MGIKGYYGEEAGIFLLKKGTGYLGGGGRNKGILWVEGKG
jgi:hypothetical protein